MRGVVQRAWNGVVHGLCTLFACKPPQPLVPSTSLPRTHGMPGHGGTVKYPFVLATVRLGRGRGRTRAFSRSAVCEARCLILDHRLETGVSCKSLLPAVRPAALLCFHKRPCLGPPGGACSLHLRSGPAIEACGTSAWAWPIVVAGTPYTGMEVHPEMPRQAMHVP